ncbi:MAG: hypothetical protein L6R40_008218 [Gallowayella cf. fulva]|nr:MAG: hypothetical protein L6R40_008218 [Xanthomendoza cf. fulva]
MQESGGPNATVESTDFTPPGLQQIYNAVRNQSTSGSPLLPPYTRGPSHPPSYASSADDSSSGLWEDGAEDILRGYDLQAIQLVCRFRTYRDESLPRKILRTRWPHLLSTFFVSLHAGDWETVVELDVDRKVERILKQLIPSFLPPDPLDIQPLHDLLHEADVSRAASELNKKSCSAFKKIAFSDWARAARDPDEYVDTVEDFFDWHGSLQDLLEDPLHQLPDERAKYIQMEKVDATTTIQFILSTNIDRSSYPSKALPVVLYPGAYGRIARIQMPFLNLAIKLFSASSRASSTGSTETPSPQ